MKKDKIQLGKIIVFLVTLITFTSILYAKDFTVIEKGDLKEKQIALTFEGEIGDAPYMEELLTLLKEEQIQATFFIPGRGIKLEQELIRRMIQEGYTIENYSYNLVDLPTLSYRDIKFQTKQTGSAIEQITGKKPNYFRPPYGSYNHTVGFAVASEGYNQIVLWNETLESLKHKQYKIENGDIINIHLNAQVATIEQIKLLISHIKKQQMKVVTLESLLDKEQSAFRVIESGDAQKKEISLTFENIEDWEAIPSILNTLDQMEVQATFFITGKYVEEQSELLREIVERGHQIGNNTYSYKDLTTVTPREMKKEIAKTDELIIKATGVKPKMIRPKGGSYNHEVGMAAAAEGYPYLALYNINPKTWDGKASELIVEEVLKKATPGGIVTLSVNKRAHTKEALPELIKALEAEGYTIRKLSDMALPDRNPLEIDQQSFMNREHFKKDFSSMGSFSMAPYVERYEPKTLFDKQKDGYKVEGYTYFNEGTISEKVMSLTFDDYGSYEHVSQVLDVLDQYQVKATFFLTGRGTLGDASVARMIADRGHEIGNHTDTHPMLATLSKGEVQNELMKAHTKLFIATGKGPTLYRPPYGDMSDEVGMVAAECGYDLLIHSEDINPKDWAGVPAEEITKQVLREAKRGGVVTLHILDEIETLEALPSMIEGLQSQGYKLVTAGEMLELAKVEGVQKERKELPLVQYPHKEVYEWNELLTLEGVDGLWMQKEGMLVLGDYSRENMIAMVIGEKEIGVSIKGKPFKTVKVDEAPLYKEGTVYLPHSYLKLIQQEE